MSASTSFESRIVHGLAGAALLLAGALPAVAQQFPERDFTMVIPFPPGGGTDLVMREIGKHVSEASGHQMIIDNRPGAGGTVATMLVKGAKPDGYTLLLGNASPN